MMTALKLALAQPAAAAMSVSRRILGTHYGHYQAIILHDVPDDRIGQLTVFLDFVRAEYGFITPQEAVVTPTRPAANPTHRMPCLVTIDDGFESSRWIGCEILPRYGAKAIFFVCPGLIDSSDAARDDLIRRNVFGGHPPANVPRLMTWNDIADLQRAGHTIGAHGSMHERLSTLDPNALETEIGDSKQRLEQHLGEAPLWYAYAFGDIGSLSQNAVKAIARHFPYCRSGVRGTNQIGDNQHILLAQEIDLNAPTRYHRAVLGGALDIRYMSARARLRNYTDTATRL